MSNELLGKKYENACSLIDKEISLMKSTDYLFNNDEIKLQEADKEISIKDAILKLEKDLAEKRKEKFTISVCGMVKAGKSTFINSFLFGRRVLPAFDTPWSAKLTFVEYTDKKPYFEAVFYSEEEFEALENGYKAQKIYDAFEKMIAKAFQKGIRKSDYIKSTNYTEIRYSYDDLEEFVTDLNNDKAIKAKYTPFVKEVHVYVNDKSIEKFRIVDTPGLHDTNVINSLETYKWVTKTHALIFLLPPKGITEDDFKFLKDYQAAKGPEGRIFVINRIDEAGSPEDAEKVRRFIKDLGKEERFKSINMFGPNEEICRYSSLAQMLQRMKEDGIPFNEDYEDEWYWEDQGLKNYDADPDKVKSKIAERLYNNAGKIIVASSVGDISQLYFRIYKTFELYSELFENEIKDCNKSIEELNIEIKKLDNIRKRVRSKFSAFITEAEREAENKKDTLVNMLEKADKDLNIDVTGYSYDELKGLPYELKLRISRILDLETGYLGREFKRYSLSLPEIAYTIQEEIREIYEENGIDEPVILNPLKNANIQEDWNYKFETELNDFKQNLDDVLPWNWFTQFFTRNTVMQANARPFIRNAVANLRSFVSGQITNYTEKIIEYVKSKIKEFISITDNVFTSKSKIVANDKQEKNLRKEELNNIIQIQKNNLDDLKNKIDNFKANCERL